MTFYEPVLVFWAAQKKIYITSQKPQCWHFLQLMNTVPFSKYHKKIFKTEKNATLISKYRYILISSDNNTYVLLKGREMSLYNKCAVLDERPVHMRSLWERMALWRWMTAWNLRFSQLSQQGQQIVPITLNGEIPHSPGSPSSPSVSC